MMISTKLHSYLPVCAAPLRYMDTDTVIKGEYIVVFKKDAEDFECKCLRCCLLVCHIDNSWGHKKTLLLNFT